MNARARAGVALCLACVASADADASDSPLSGDGLGMLAAMAGLWLCIVVVTLVVVARRWRRLGRVAFWYLLVPLETAAITAVGITLIEGSDFAAALGATGSTALALGVELVAWAIACLLHLEDGRGGMPFVQGTEQRGD